MSSITVHKSHALPTCSFSIAASLLFLFTLVVMPSGATADIYKYVDDGGVIHFSNVPADRESRKVIKEAVGPKKPGGGPVLIPPGKTKTYVEAKKSGDYQPLPDGCTPYTEIINNKCQKYGVDPSLVKAIIKAESNFNPNAVSPKGARGLMQLMPETANDMQVCDIFDPEQNIDGGVRYLKFLLDNFAGDVELSVAAYNCGQGRVIRNGNCVPAIPETQNYVKKVMKLSNNPITGMSFTRPIYRVELKDGSIMFTDNPSSGSTTSLVN
jgi:hypothetical protein